MFRQEGLGLLVRNEKDELVKASQHLKTPSGIPSKSIRAFHRSMIGKAEKALESQSVEERFFLGKTMAIAFEDMPRFQQILSDCMQEVGLKGKETQKADSLYQLNIQFFNLKDGRC